MHKIALLLAYLVCMVHGWCTEASSILARILSRAEVKLVNCSPSTKRVSTCDALAIFAKFCLALKPTSAWSAGAQAALDPLGSPALRTLHALTSQSRFIERIRSDSLYRRRGLALASNLFAFEHPTAFKLARLAAPIQRLVHRTGHIHMSSTDAVLPTATEREAVLPTATELEDSRIWLEGAFDGRVKEWVYERSSHAMSAFGNPLMSPDCQPAFNRFGNILQSSERIPEIHIVINGLIYNIWSDEEYSSVLRRCPLDEYRKKKPNWEIVVDMGALKQQQHGEFSNLMSWEISAVAPSERTDRVIFNLYRQGSDAAFKHEFDLDKKEFVPEHEGGFVLPEGKTNVCYKDRDTLLVGDVFGGQEMTYTGFSRSVYEWQRGTPLSSAKKVFEGEQTDVQVFCFDASFFVRRITLNTFWYGLQQSDGRVVHIPIPEDASILARDETEFLLVLQSPWLGHDAGTLLSVQFEPLMRAGDDEARKAAVTVLFVPTETCSMQDVEVTENYVIIQVLNNVVPELRFWKQDSGTWTLESSYKEEGYIVTAESATRNALLLHKASYTQPPTLLLADASTPHEQEVLKSMPSLFDATGVTTKQHFAISVDGTRVPYFLISKTDMPLDGSTPTLMFGYGGFGESQAVKYDALVGAGWLEKGYAYVVANIRGGGEYGESWYKSGIMENRNNGYEDFESVARDLIARGITSSKKLACKGVSNGGLLTANMLVRSPELFGAIICGSPVLDMYRYPRLGAGAAWLTEYGIPERDWDWLQQFSPYHNIKLETEYPPILFFSRTHDDRVHPGHARKMVHKLLDMGKNNVYYYEAPTGGHELASVRGLAFMATMEYRFLEFALGVA